MSLALILGLSIPSFLLLVAVYLHFFEGFNQLFGDSRKMKELIDPRHDDMDEEEGVGVEGVDVGGFGEEDDNA
jgi:hypothetical protein